MFKFPSSGGRTLAIVAALAAVILSAAAAHGQDAGLRATIQSVTELPYPSAQAVVNIEDTSGGSLAGLEASNFIVTSNGKLAKVSKAELASSQTIPLDVLLLIDTSGSTQGEGVAQAKSAAVSFITRLAPEDRVAVMRFANSVTLQQDYTADKNAAIAAVNTLESKGQTELYKATDAAIRQAATSTSARRAMILLTDGAGDAIVTDVSENQALATANSSGVPVFTIAQGAAILDPGYLIDLADVSNGRYLEAPAPGDLTGVYQSIGRLLQNQYIVTFDASEAAGKPEIGIDVQVSATGRTATASAIFKPGAAFIAPALTVTGLAVGDALTEKRDITVTSTGTQPITKAAFYVDDVNVFETTTAPFSYTYDPDRFAGSPHALRVSATIGEKIIDGAPVSFSSVPANPVDVTDPVADAGGGGGLPILPIAGILALLTMVGIGFLVIQRIKTTSGPTLAIASPDQRVTPWATRHRGIAKSANEDGSAPVAPPKVEEVGEALGVLISRSGSDVGREYAVGAKPVSIGSGTSCALRIDDPTLATEEARLWIRKGSLMFHKITRLTTIAAEGAAGGWIMMEPGESFTIGEHAFEFRLLPEGAPQPESLANNTPVNLPNVLREKAAPDPRPSPGFSPTSNPAMAEQKPRRLTEMMPRDRGFSNQDMDGDEQAS